jgi:penicillin amidase
MGCKVLITCCTIITIPLFSLIFLYALSYPPRGTYKLSTINGEATVVFEKEYEMPYIMGTTNESVAYALGFVHAADRLFDMVIRRAAAYGRLSEVIDWDLTGVDLRQGDHRIRHVHALPSV